MIDVNELIKSALKNKSQIELNVYRSIKTKITEFRSAKNAKDYTEAAEIQLLDKMRRERLDSAKEYSKGGRSDLAATEIVEAEIISKLLPKSPSESELNLEVKNWIKKNNYIIEKESSEYQVNGIPLIEEYEQIPKKEMGRCIKEIKEKLPLADGNLLSTIVKKYLV